MQQQRAANESSFMATIRKLKVFTTIAPSLISAALQKKRLSRACAQKSDADMGPQNRCFSQPGTCGD